MLNQVIYMKLTGEAALTDDSWALKCIASKSESEPFLLHNRLKLTLITVLYILTIEYWFLKFYQ